MPKSVENMIGEQIAKLRKERELTQDRLAGLVNVATETISRLERGVSTTSIKTLENISQALHVSLKDFFDFEYSLKHKDTSSEKELDKLITFLKTKRKEDIKMCYRILRNVFDQIEKNYGPKYTLKRPK